MAGESLLRRNLDALAEHGVVLAQETNEGPQVRLDPGGVDDASLTLGIADGRWIRLHSRHAPATEADRLMAPAFESGEPALVVVIGLGLGYVLDAVERRSSRTKVLALEPVPASLRHMLARRDWCTWLMDGRLRLLVGPDYSGASDAWTDFDADASMPPIVIHPVLGHHAGEGVARAREVVERIAFGARSNLNARKRFAGRYLLNTLKNLSVIAGEANAGALFDAFKGVPAIIASAGPSLDRNIPQLQDVPDRALLIAADTALRPLLGAGIDPHLVVGVDPGETNARHLTNLPDPGRTWLVAEASMDPVVFEQFEGRTFIFNVSNHHPWPWLGGLGLERGRLRAWGSVATSAFDLALKMGCDPIIFAGQDLAYTGGQPYCRGTTFERDWAVQVAHGIELPDIWSRILAQSGALIVDDVSGHEVVTMPQLVAFRDWFSEQTSLLDRRTVINATGGGILRGPGIRQSGLASVLTSLPPLQGLNTLVRESWNRTEHARAATKMTERQLLEAFIHAGRGEELTTWASFANLTSSALSTELEGVTAILQRQLVDAARTRRPTASPTASPDVDPHPRPVVHASERIRVCRAVLLDGEVPEWARPAAVLIGSFDTPAFQEALDRLPPGLLLLAAERCEAAAAFSHAAALYSRLADRWKQDPDPESARSATISWLRCLFWAGSFEAALSLVEREAWLPRECAVSYIAQIHHLMDDHEQAIAKIEGLVAAYPDMVDPRFALAVRLAMNGNLQDALALVDIDATRRPGRVPPEYPRGVCLRVHGDYEGARQALSAIVEEYPYAAPDLLVASVAAEQPDAIEQSLRTIRNSFRCPVVFLNVPGGQSTIVHTALARLGAELTTEHCHVEVTRPSPVAVRLLTLPPHAWRPTWRP